MIDHVHTSIISLIGTKSEISKPNPEQSPYQAIRSIIGREPK